LRRRLATLTLSAAALAVAATACGPSYPPQYVPGAAPGIAQAYVSRTSNFANFYSISNEHFSSPAVGDFVAPGKPSIIAGYSDGIVRVTDAATGAAQWSFNTGAGAVQASPVVTDVNGDGKLDAVLTNTRGDVWVVTPSTGSAWFHTTIGSGAVNNGALATPAVADINGDGYKDIVETGWDQMLHVWSTNPASFGRELPGFPLHLQDTSWSSPAVADVDKDGKPEIIFGYDCDGAPGQYCRTRYNSYGGFVTVIRSNGTIQPGWPRFVPHQVVWSTPAVSDINGDGWLDVVVGTGNMNATMYDGGKQPMDGGHVVNAFTGRTGVPLPGWPAAIQANATGSPVVADLDNDGHKEVVEIGEDGRMYVLNSAGVVRAMTCVADNLNGCPHWLHTTPSIADVNNDGKQEIVVGGEQWLDVYSYNNGALRLIGRGWQRKRVQRLRCCPAGDQRRREGDRVRQHRHSLRRPGRSTARLEVSHCARGSCLAGIQTRCRPHGHWLTPDLSARRRGPDYLVPGSGVVLPTS